jgi:methyl-accepting chemotaxis protein
MENLAKTLGEAGKSLNDFPEKLQIMTDTLNNNFAGLQGVIKNIGEETFKTSDEINKKMQNDIKEMAEILKDNVSIIQDGQGNIVAEQSKNLQLSENLLSAFNTSIESMNNISSKVNDILSEFKSVHNGMISATNEFKIISENVNSSTNNTKIAQENFSKYSNEFIKGNQETIEKIIDTIQISVNLVDEYTVKFEIIEQGLKGIFSQIDNGLNQYQKNVGSSLESYLTKYSDALTSTAQSLSSASQEQFEILEELSEQLSKLKK